MSNKLNINSDFPTIDPGSFRHQVTLLVPNIGSDVAGSVVAWGPTTPTTTAWAKVDYLRGAEIIKSGQDVTNVYIKLTMWYRSAFTVNSRVQLPSGEQFVIQYLENVQGMNCFLVLTCLGIGASDQ